METHTTPLTHVLTGAPGEDSHGPEAFRDLLMTLAVSFVNTPLDDLHKAIVTALGEAASFAGADRGYVFHYDFVRHTTTNVQEWCAEGIPAAIDDLIDVPLDNFSQWSEAHLAHQPIVIPSVADLGPEEVDLQQILEAQEIQSLIALPMWANGECLGFVGFDAVRHQRAWTRAELDLLTVLAELIANAEVRRRYDEDLVTARNDLTVATRRLHLALQVASDALWEFTPTTGVLTLSDSFYQLLGYERADWQGGDEGLLAHVIDPTDTDTLAWMQRGRPGDSGAHEVRMRHRDGREVPLLLSGAVLRDGDGRSVAITGIARDLTAMHHEQESAARRLALGALLNRVSALLVGVRSLRDVLPEVLADIGQTFNASRARLIITPPVEDLVTCAAEWHDPRETALPRFPEDGVPRAALTGMLERLETGQTVEVPDVRDLIFGPDRDLLVQQRVRSLVDVPVVFGGHLEAVLGLDHAHRSRAWDADAVGALRQVAENLAGALARERAEESLMAAREAADHANRAKSRFLSTISHEIRTPLNGILGLLELLTDDEPDELRRADLTLVMSAATSLRMLLGDLLDFTRIESGQLVLEPADTNITEVVDDVVRLFERDAAAKGVELTVHLLPGPPTWRSVDALRLRQIVANLVSNAVKFTPSGGHVQVRLDVGDGETDSVRLAVLDDGPGMSPENLSRAFDPFARFESGSPSAADGTGLGLPIVKNLVEAMDGQLILDSRPGVGTSAVVELSLPRTAQSHRMATRRRLHPTQIDHTITVLVADDNPINQLVLSRHLDRLGLDHVTVANGQQALEALDSEPIDLVLMDSHMPMLSGLAATRLIRDRQSSDHVVPIIAVTADANREHIEECFAAGVNAVLTKPFLHDQLVDAIVDVLSVVGPALASADGAAQASSMPVFDPAVLDRLLADTVSGPELAVRVIDLFTEHAGTYVARMEAALGADDPASFHIAAHTLKSSSAAVGLLLLRRQCAELEAATQPPTSNVAAAWVRPLDEIALDVHHLHDNVTAARRRLTRHRSTLLGGTR